jgi:hypothetical protein
VQTLLDAPLVFETANGPTHAPMVEAEVGGLPTRLIVDTGSTVHILTTELTERLGLTPEPGEPGTDSSGGSVPSWRLPAVEVTVAGHRFAFDDVVVITAPEPFRTGGIGGILSPQLLHPSARVVLDLRGGRLAMLEAEAAELEAWLADRCPDLQRVVLPGVEGDGTVLIEAGVAPFAPVVTMLDTGAKVTQFAAAAVPGLEGGERSSSGRGVGGGETFGIEVHGQQLAVGNARLPIPRLMVGEDGHGDALGLVGMDLLRGTVLVVGADRDRLIEWLVPRTGATG